MPAVGDYLRSVLFKLTVAGGALDSKPPAVWTAASPVQFAVTPALDVPGEPETLLQVSGANTPDPSSTPRGVVLLGTLTVNVASAGLVAISGVILSMESVSTAECGHHPFAPCVTRGSPSWRDAWLALLACRLTCPLA